jgi:thiamine biosynthesis lipoprotein
MSNIRKLKAYISHIINFNNVHDGENYLTIRGLAEGTSYNITYHDNRKRDFAEDIKELLSGYEKSMSVYDPDSTISKINRNESIQADKYFIEVFNKAKEISALTDGYFDMSAEPLFKAWGFSFGNKTTLDAKEIEALKQSVGMDKIALKGRRVVKSNPNAVVNGNAIAKGYSADIVAEFLEQKGIINYLVEIGGEIRIKGKNISGEIWRIGIDKPVDGNHIPGQEMQVILQITDRAIATSGNYRQFYIDENGQKVSHTIDPKTGYPVKHNLLSTTVIAKDAMSADAIATAFMVMGVEKALNYSQKMKDVDALFIYNEKGEYKVTYTPGMDKYITDIM